MMPMSRAGESFALVERELQEERAAALVRIATTLESLVERLKAVRAEIAAQAEPARSERVGAYESIRRDAKRYRWYLEVQRESVGFLRHDVLDEIYPIPGSIQG